jgi:DNA-binding transcriptional ArsR family regulator
MGSVSASSGPDPGRAGEQQPPAGRPAGQAGQVTSVETLKAMADPLRLAILTALMRDEHNLRVMSVKELAAELGEPQTRLYRHVKQLEAAGLIRVAASRVVSGIIEQRYQACQASLALGPDIIRGPRQAAEGAAVVTALIDRFRRRFLARQAAAGDQPADGRPQDAMLVTATTVAPATARLIRDKLQEVIDAIGRPVPAGETGVPVEVLLGFFRPDR